MNAPRIASPPATSEAENVSPPVVGATEGEGIVLGTNAGTCYRQTGGGDKPSPLATKYEAQNATGRLRGGVPAIAFRGSSGQIWRYRNKRARVLEMLVTMPQGVTQWDCLPWHTRLSASIHAMRSDGLLIDTELEGDFRHGRYRLRTQGCLLTNPNITRATGAALSGDAL